MKISQQQKQILHILADGQFHSGTEISELLGVTRSAIWKHLTGLDKLGIEFSAISGKGYRLDLPLNLLDYDKILAQLAHSSLSALEIFDQIDSTNAYLVEQAHAGADSGTVCLAEHQTAGKGRRGREWVSPFGQNIYLSILWRFQNGPAAIAGLSLAAGVAVVKTLEQYKINNLGLKWPNDLYWQGKKLGGILVEVSGESEGPCVAVLGLGLNLFLPEHQAASITQAWTDLSRVTGSPINYRNRLAASLIGNLLTVLAEFEDKGIVAYLDEWRRYDCMLGKQVSIYMANHILQGIASGIDENGFFLLKNNEGQIKAYASGEVSFSQGA